ncbi:hypothetical protein [Maribacter sp. ACAM166]|uniref:hypothetical protein n=1 Tax=Maribacter sp. ACAM166 TaxID=2508996 RepID=UPI0010FD4ED3|nr:hypothetical protein [Maribacter sp. ACAM166]TLP82604.1 hypothetical protein ES765_00080 [Maribacter sp. ACAM166]
MKKNILLILLAVGVMFNVTGMSISKTVETNAEIIIADEFVKIKSSELTSPVVEQILKQYPTSKLGAAYKNDRGEFKLIMVLKSGTRRTVFIDQHGNWITKK